MSSDQRFGHASRGVGSFIRDDPGLDMRWVHSRSGLVIAVVAWSNPHQYPDPDRGIDETGYRVIVRPAEGEARELGDWTADRQSAIQRASEWMRAHPDGRVRLGGDDDE